MTNHAPQAAAESRDRTIHRPEKAVYQIREEGGDLVVSCQYWEVRHSRNLGGNISNVVFPHGSGRNIFAAPFSTQIRRGDAWQFDTFDNTLDTDPAFTFAQDGERVRVESRTRLLDKDGKALPAVCTHSFEYHAWGYLRQSVTIGFPEPTAKIWNIKIARPVVAAHLDEFAYRPSWESATEWRRHCNLGSWYRLEKGDSFRDYLAVETGEIPLYLMFLQRGVEGFDWFCGENLDQWHGQLTDIPHAGKFRVVYNEDAKGYEVDLAPLDIWTSSLELKGKYTFDFFMALPFVQEHVRPMLRGGGLTCGYGRPFMPSSEKIAEMAEHQVQLLRHHDDCPKQDGIFWRDGSYPPYPPEVMQRMDASLKALHQHGIKVAPYFSLHEWHPDSPSFAEKAEQCKRSVNARGEMVHNPVPHGEFGAQMCLLSDWEGLLKGHMDRVLKHHAFDGLYFDWTFALPCLNRQHRPFIHWDVEGFIRVMEWSRDRVGPDGILYLHMSLEPFIVAENLATVVLVYESPGPRRPTGDMFPPIAEFMKTCSRFVLTTEAQKRDPRRYLLYALLSHVTTDDPSAEFLAAYKVLAKIDFTRYRSFADYRKSPIEVSSKDVLSATYWNENEALLLFANLSDQTVVYRWQLDTARFGWPEDQTNVAWPRRGTLGPLAFRYVRFDRPPRSP
jgi:hypothetical protein